jgi:hypothetical protein
MRRGAIEYECDDGTTFWWESCEITGCQFGVCMGMSESLCYQHGIEFGAFTKEQFEADRLRRHPANGNEPR